MARECHYCGKKPLTGNKVSHANNKSKKRSFPNLQTVKVVLQGIVTTIRLCTRCIRSNVYTKAA